MNTSTGEILKLDRAQEAAKMKAKLGDTLVPITEAEATTLQAMPAEDRLAHFTAMRGGGKLLRAAQRFAQRR